MNLLIDSHTFLWFVWDDPLLSAAAKKLVTNPTIRKLVSVASCWEIAIKTSIGKLTLGEPIASFLPREISKNNFEVLPIRIDHIAVVETLPFHHRDPFDRIIVAQALVENIPIVSIDRALDPYGVKRSW
jgi:PIN domain nuclease of toxin-antitoxin system